MSLSNLGIVLQEEKGAYFRSHCRLKVLLHSSQAYGALTFSGEVGGSCGASGGCQLDEVKSDGLSTGASMLSSKGAKLKSCAIRFCGSFGGCSLDRVRRRGEEKSSGGKSKNSSSGKRLYKS